MWAGPVFGIWILICGLIPLFAFSGIGHGSIFIVGPALILAFVGATLHVIAVFRLPLHALGSFAVAAVIGLFSAIISFLIFIGTFHVSAADILSGGGGIVFAGLAIWSLLTAIGISQFYLRRKLTVSRLDI
jgi:hypothetical protein